MQQVHIDNKVIALAQARDNVQTAKAQMDSLLKEITDSAMFRALKAAYESNKADAEQTEAELKEMGLKVFEQTQEKTLHGAVKVKLYDTISYDIAEATEYAKTNLPSLMMLNVDAFEALAKSVRKNAPLPCVEFKDVPKVCVDRDLSRFVPVANAKASKAA